MPKATKNEGRVNVPLGPSKKQFDRLAKSQQTTPTNLARVIILRGMELIETGEWSFKPSTVEYSPK